MRPPSTSQSVWLLLIAYWILLTGLLVTPQPWNFLGAFQDPVKEAIELGLADYVRHFLAFSLLASLAWSARRSRGWPTNAQFLSGLFIYSILTEIIQGPIPERTFQWLDLLANATGLIFGWSLPALLWRRRPSPPTG